MAMLLLLHLGVGVSEVGCAISVCLHFFVCLQQSKEKEGPKDKKEDGKKAAEGQAAAAADGSTSGTDGKA